MPKYKILKLKADRIITFGQLSNVTVREQNSIFNIDLDNETIYSNVVEEQLLMDNCALFDQFQIQLGKNECEEKIREWLLSEVVIVDFTNIYKAKTDIPDDLVEKLITEGFIMRYLKQEIHMLPFDKSGNMSRQCRLSFINAKHLEKMNERLNIGIDFGKISLNLSKFYAYRGLYLSTATRIQHELLKITPETVVVVNDTLNKKFYNYQPKVDIIEGKVDNDDKSKISFCETKVDRENIEVPFDGQGIISPLYADLVNEVMGETNINSFQIRLPFSKGMLHRVDFHGFLHEFDRDYENDVYEIKDAFGIQRDLKRANIIMTKSMFKCFSWLKEFCAGEEDPMKYYCDALEKYGHTLYVSSTDLPYGNSKVTHTSYQLLNTLQLSEEQFNSLINKQLEYVKNPIEYIKLTQGQQSIDDVDIDNDLEECGGYGLANWQKAVLVNPSFAKTPYIKSQLKNIQVALMTKLVLGKLVVKGQTRYLTRDLPSMLVNLIKNERIREELSNFKIFSYRFYLPQGSDGKNEMGLDYYKYCGFFRSPHLSRNEERLLAPVVKCDRWSEKYNNDCSTMDKYFGHLTGVVMVGNESLEPMALGGADFDGDLVNMIMDEDVVVAIRSGVYTETTRGALDIKRRKDVPYIKIPSMPPNNEVVPRTITYMQIKNTFSNKIGLISNAAISIGQYEYGNKKGKNPDIKCAYCTILTGLEIDAAKNGVHPDLSRLTEDNSLTTCGYLEFKKDFEQLKKHKDYHFNQLVYKKHKNEHVLSLSGTKEIIKYVEENGTCINKLPIKFMENLNPKLNIPRNSRNKYFNFPKIELEQQKEVVFTEQCNMIFASYKYYSGLFKFIQKDTSNIDYNMGNLQKILKRQYDAEYVQKILSEDVPYILGLFADKINSYTTFKKFTKQINEQRWHLLSKDKKIEFLCENLQIESIDEDAWSIILQPYNHNHKVLWYMVQNVGHALKPIYSELKNSYNKYIKWEGQLSPYVEKQADKLIKSYLENRTMGVSLKIYDICLVELHDMVEQSGIPSSSKIKILFELAKNSSWKAKFFWDCFEWEEIEPYIVKENDYAE